MGGPIVRTGTTPEFWANWDNVFGGKGKKKKAKKSAGAKAAAKSPKKAKKKASKKSRKN